MKLPCCHIFTFSNLHQIPLYDETLFATRWTKAYTYVKGAKYSSKEIDDVVEEDLPCVGIQQTAYPAISKCLTQFQKNQQANIPGACCIKALQSYYILVVAGIVWIQQMAAVFQFIHNEDELNRKAL